MSEEGSQRHSVALEADLISDADLKAQAEARNGLRQFDVAMEMVEAFLQPDRPFKLRPSHILTLHRAALENISAYAGNYRPGSVEINGSQHVPLGAHLVPELIEEMCDYVNDHWQDRNAFHLAAYLMWRLNWIHPFADGNGRTSRILSYMVLCIKTGVRFPGRKTIPEQIAEDRRPYFAALDAADAAWKKTQQVDVSVMEKLVETLLGQQLYTLVEQARGGD